MGRFRPGDAVSSAVLARYLVGRVLAERLSASLYLAGLLIVLGAVALWLGGVHWLAVLVGLVGLAVLAARALLMAVLRGLMAVGRLGDAEGKVRRLVRDTRGDFRRELRRLHLPASLLGMPLLALRLLGRRRRETLDRLSGFDVTRVVPTDRLDDLSFIVHNDVLHRPSRPAP